MKPSVWKSSKKSTWLAAITSVVLLSLCGPSTNLWPLCFLGLVGILQIGRTSLPGWKLAVYVSFFAFYFISLQGLRHAHPLMIVPLTVFAAYLAVYPLLFVTMLRRITSQAHGSASAASNAIRSVPFSIVAAILWVGGELVRNYFATGISVLMLGHSLAGMPSGILLQIADCLGTYGVSFLIVLVNAAVADLVFRGRSSVSQSDSTTTTEKSESSDESSNTASFEKDCASSPRWAVACNSYITSVPIAVIALGLTYAYGSRALEYPTTTSGTTFLLVGRDEQTEYQQDFQREVDIFSAYARQSIAAVHGSEKPVDAVVWPESMLSGGQPWNIAEDKLTVPPHMREAGMDEPKMREIISQSQLEFNRRSVDLISALNSGDTSRSPSIIGGCGLVRYGETAKQFSGVIHIGPDAEVANSYAKNHLVMFGEYIPLIKSIPIAKDMVPPGLGLDAGVGPAVFEVGSLDVLPNLCIETAVERVSVNHMRTLWQKTPERIPDVIVTLTNDAWFDHSSVVEHHLRCAQLVAIGCRRPILSAANGGPTAWIDSSGRIIQKLPLDAAGTIAATPQIDDRVSLYVRHGVTWALPTGAAWVCGLLVVLSTLWQKRPFFRQADR
ncbi:MAG: apolipoprotein N-acyltransferase [Rhodopirellula sp. JB044]|uniref:apolipoprotein N-acyltransferase n=1 Tax=Rhodopirellula sp. JB044 TaxID=3342844 RepID=UPI00370BCDB0